MQERGVVCELCKYANVNVLQAHHVKRRSDGGTDDLSNLQLLCPNCHATIHLGDSRTLIHTKIKKIKQELCHSE